MESVQQNIALIRQRVAAACARVKRDVKDITVVGVAKKKSAELIVEAFQAGIWDIGENYVQEFLPKYRTLGAMDLRWHFVGHLQRRKVRDVIGKVAWIHSLDLFQLAYEIDKRAGAAGMVQKCLMQVNVGGEMQKSGIDQMEVAPLLRDLDGMKHLEVCGLMALPPYFENAERSRPFFQLLRHLMALVNEKKVYRRPLTELSMGMTHDFEIAIEEGATMIRIGEGIFGHRTP